MTNVRRWLRRSIVPSTVMLMAVVVAVPETVPAQVPKFERVATRRKRQPALEGYCPVAYLLLQKVVKGESAFTSRHAGELYKLSSAEAKKQFDADPGRFLPQFGGLCTTALGGSYGNRLPSDPEVFEIRNGKLYLFSSPRAKKAYDTNPQRYITRAAELFEEPALDGYCPVSYQQRNQALKGQPGAKFLYRQRVYHFVDEEAQAKFIKEPHRFLPEFDGYCAEGVSRGKRYPADPTLFVVHNGRTYLFFDSKAKAEFIAHPEKLIPAADFNWTSLRDKPQD